MEKKLALQSEHCRKKVAKSHHLTQKLTPAINLGMCQSQQKNIPEKGVYNSSGKKKTLPPISAHTSKKPFPLFP